MIDFNITKVVNSEYGKRECNIQAVFFCCGCIYERSTYDIGGKFSYWPQTCSMHAHKLKAVKE